MTKQLNYDVLQTKAEDKYHEHGTFIRLDLIDEDNNRYIGEVYGLEILTEETSATRVILCEGSHGPTIFLLYKDEQFEEVEFGEFLSDLNNSQLIQLYALFGEAAIVPIP